MRCFAEEKKDEINIYLYFHNCLNISIFPILVKKVQLIDWPLPECAMSG